MNNPIPEPAADSAANAVDNTPKPQPRRTLLQPNSSPNTKGGWQKPMIDPQFREKTPPARG